MLSLWDHDVSAASHPVWDELTARSVPTHTREPHITPPVLTPLHTAIECLDEEDYSRLNIWTHACESSILHLLTVWDELTARSVPTHTREPYITPPVLTPLHTAIECLDGEDYSRLNVWTHACEHPYSIHWPSDAYSTQRWWEIDFQTDWLEATKSPCLVVHACMCVCT